MTSSQTNNESLIQELNDKIDRLQSLLEEQWLIVHDDYCSNTHTCESFGGERACEHPRPWK